MSNAGTAEPCLTVFLFSVIPVCVQSLRQAPFDFARLRSGQAFVPQCQPLEETPSIPLIRGTAETLSLLIMGAGGQLLRTTTHRTTRDEATKEEAQVVIRNKLARLSVGAGQLVRPLFLWASLF